MDTIGFCFRSSLRVTRLAGGKGGEGWILLTFANMNKVRQQSGDLVGLLELV